MACDEEHAVRLRAAAGPWGTRSGDAYEFFFGAALSPRVRAFSNVPDVFFIYFMRGGPRSADLVSRVRARRGVRCESYDNMVVAEKLCQDYEPVYEAFGHPFRKER